MSRKQAHLFTALKRTSRKPQQARTEDVCRYLVERLFPAQRDFVLDPARRKSALCPRRSGKTFACIALLLLTALTKPGANILYVTLTRLQSERLVWTKLKEFNEQWRLGMSFHETLLRVTFPNGSRIFLQGGETRSECEKNRGIAADLCVIDEGKSFGRYVLEEFITEIILPALTDRAGSLVLLGTPGGTLAGPFFNATNTANAEVKPYREDSDREFTWSFHRWTMRDNDRVLDRDGNRVNLWEIALEDKRANGWDDDDPRWMREYLGQWAASDDILVYAFDESRDLWEPDPKSTNAWGLPDEHEWHYLFGYDFGFEDPFAISVVAYSETCPTLYQVWDWKAPRLTIPEIAAAIDRAEQQFGQPAVEVGDPGNFGKALIATMNQEYGRNIIPAEKASKKDYIEFLNSDLKHNRLKLATGSNVIDEMRLLVWSSKDKRKEQEGLANHCCDALLYTWRYCYHHYSKPMQAALDPGSREWQRRERDQAFQAAVKRKTDTQVQRPGSRPPSFFEPNPVDVYL